MRRECGERDRARRGTLEANDLRPVVAGAIWWQRQSAELSCGKMAPGRGKCGEVRGFGGEKWRAGRGRVEVKVKPKSPAWELPRRDQGACGEWTLSESLARLVLTERQCGEAERREGSVVEAASDFASSQCQARACSKMRGLIGHGQTVCRDDWSNPPHRPWNFHMLASASWSCLNHHVFIFLWF